MRAIWVFCWLLSTLASATPAAAAGRVESSLPVQKSGSEAAGDTKAGSGADSLWMISTRQVACPCGSLPSAAQLRFSRYEPSCGWQVADADQWAHASGAEAMTLVYVHGNRIEADEAPRRGLAAYRALLRSRPAVPAIRFVVWSWPSSKISRPRPRLDAQVKAVRTDCESYLLADFLQGLEPDTRLCLLGYSFGARIVSGALHLSGGGTLGRFHLADAGARPASPAHVVLYAAALDNSWWLPGGYHDLAVSQVERLLLLYNPADLVLRLYPRLDPRSPAAALGYTGLLRPARLGQDAARLEQANACCQIGKTHDEQAYFASETLMRRVRQTLFEP
jgi:hypothetical protein